MQIVIDIPVITLLNITSRELLLCSREDIEKLELAIKNGTPLPKGHGRLIDVDKLELDDGYSNYDGYYHRYSQSQIYNAPTIIEADSEVKK